jgi:hypothetical protein
VLVLAIFPFRLRIAFLPILLTLHQSQLDFLINFFGAKSSSVDQSPAYQDLDASKLLQDHRIANEAMLPYFQASCVGYNLFIYARYFCIVFFFFGQCAFGFCLL